MPSLPRRLLELFYLHHYSQLLRFLLESVALNWHPAFPEVEQRLLFDDFFVSGDPGEDLVFSHYFFLQFVLSFYLLIYLPQNRSDLVGRPVKFIELD